MYTPKRPQPTLLATAAFLAAAVLNSHAQSWETIVELPSNTHGDSIMIDPFSTDPNLPDLFIGGDPGSVGSDNSFVLHVDQSTYYPGLQVLTSDPQAPSRNHLGYDPVGNLLYSAGDGWVVRGSTNGGVTWDVADDGSWWSSTSTISRKAFPGGLATDAAGNVFITGYASETAQSKRGSTSTSYWVIRKRSAGGQSWTNCFKSASFQPPLYPVGDIVFVPPNGLHAGGVFAANCLPTSKGALQWSVLRSRNGGASWQQVDAFGTSKTGNAGAYARAITADPAGNVYVAGYDGVGTPGWYVRRSVDGGDTWETILADYAGGDYYNRADDIASDSWGNIYVVGMTWNTGEGPQWTVRRWDAASETWDQWPTELRHPLSTAFASSFASGVTTDVAGHVYVIGSGSDSDGWSHLVLQRLQSQLP